MSLRKIESMDLMSLKSINFSCYRKNFFTDIMRNFFEAYQLLKIHKIMRWIYLQQAQTAINSSTIDADRKVWGLNIDEELQTHHSRCIGARETKSITKSPWENAEISRREGWTFWSVSWLQEGHQGWRICHRPGQPSTRMTSQRSAPSS